LDFWLWFLLCASHGNALPMDSRPPCFHGGNLGPGAPRLLGPSVLLKPPPGRWGGGLTPPPRKLMNPCTRDPARKGGGARQFPSVPPATPSPLRVGRPDGLPDRRHRGGPWPGGPGCQRHRQLLGQVPASGLGWRGVSHHGVAIRLGWPTPHPSGIPRPLFPRPPPSPLFHPNQPPRILSWTPPPLHRRRPGPRSPSATRWGSTTGSSASPSPVSAGASRGTAWPGVRPGLTGGWVRGPF